MGYFLIEDFSPGLDLRKSDVTARPGTLRTLKNAAINAGGEVEKRKQLTKIATLPGGTHGLGFSGNKLQVVGTDVAPGGLPSFVGYTQTAAGGAGSIVRVHDVQVFGTDLYIVAEFSNGTFRHYYGGAHVVSAAGTNVRAHKSKMYAVDGQNLRFSAVKDPTQWSSGTGYGSIDVTTEDQGSGDLLGIEQYYSNLALFGRSSVQVWAMDPDPALNTHQQTLGNIGLVAPNAVSRYGNGDVLFLSHTGIRSLRARDSSNAAVLNDIGSPVDALIQEKRATLVPADVPFITALVDPLTGRFWLVWKNEVIVLSLYPNSKVSAWSTYVFDEGVDYITIGNSRVAIRSGDDVYVYGSIVDAGNPFDPNVTTGSQEFDFDDTVAEVQTQFIDLNKPASVKHWTGVDVACGGEWVLEANPDPNAPDVWTEIATISRPTFNDGRIPLDFRSTHIAFRLKSKNYGPSTLGALALHFEGGEDS